MQNLLKKSISIFALTICLGFVAFASPTDNPVTLKDLDRIILRAGSIDGFLNNSDIQDEYFEALQRFYGGSDKFRRDSYDAIIEQLSKLGQKVPEIKNRLWEVPNGTATTEIQTSLRTSGRTLADGKWKSALRKWEQELKRKSASLTKLNETQLSKQIEQYSNHFQAELKRVQEECAGLTKSQQTSKLAEFYKTEKLKPEVQELSANILQRYLSQERVTDILGSGDADIILDALDNLNQNAKRLFPSPTGFDSLPSPILSQIKDLTPSRGAWLERTDIFPVRTRLTRSGNAIAVGSNSQEVYRFESTPRRIHGIWKGVSIGECVGGGASEHVTPQRWATVALQDSQLYYVSQAEGSYHGFVQIVPVRHGEDIYGSVDFGASSLARKSFVRLEDGTHFESTLFDIWVESVKDKLNPKWKGLVVSDSDAINNAGVLDTVRQSPRYQLGNPVGKSSEFQLTDELGAKIVKAFPAKEGYAKVYGGRMIFDAMVKDADELTELTHFSNDYLAASQDKVQAQITEAMIGRLERSGATSIFSNSVTERLTQAELTRDQLDRLHNVALSNKKLGGFKSKDSIVFEVLIKKETDPNRLKSLLKSTIKGTTGVRRNKSLIDVYIGKYGWDQEVDEMALNNAKLAFADGATFDQREALKLLDQIQSIPEKRKHLLLQIASNARSEEPAELAIDALLKEDLTPEELRIIQKTKHASNNEDLLKRIEKRITSAQSGCIRAKLGSLLN